MDTELTPKPRLHRLSEVIARTDLSRSALYRLIGAGHLHAIKVGKALRISEAELCRFIAALESGELIIGSVKVEQK
jgi:excisionase family DNA binding protein